MIKPNGLTPVFSGSPPSLSLRVTRATQAEDAIWGAVEKAIEEGMTPERFRSEVSQAWRENLRDEAKHVRKVFNW